MRHPEMADLALYAGGDLHLFNRWSVERHARGCNRCREQIEAFQGAQGWVGDAANQLPDGLQWNRLASEMQGNIHVGLAAGQAVATPEREPVRFGWRVAAALSAACLVVASVWWLHLLRPGVDNDGVMLAATPAGIELTQQNGSFTLLNNTTEPVVVTVSAEGSMAARNYDEESGLVTINSVYTD